ncbi:MAG TPA: 4Fe-4S dicluster domain-containing protein [bacterium]|nr:4Fe-4S dicluster domain-containing protein [bacterium]HOL49508.1 4Fe-4S dicluster domain-containing protein [bacterium]HPO51679.1 4Fe-4S dicluster domain-containing protein [bacterium]HXK45703.1 4Fe-4S dicluster domain-containing protein [bacterium]
MVKNLQKKINTIVAKEEFCIGCRLCEIACITAHSKTKNIIKAFKGEYPLPESSIVFEEKGYVSFALQCRHCDDALCVECCITGAMTKKDGRVIYRKELCVGCWMCVMVCGFGVIAPDINTHKIKSKCDFCLETGKPACVEMCPNEALVLKETHEQD